MVFFPSKDILRGCYPNTLLNITSHNVIKPYMASKKDSEPGKRTMNPIVAGSIAGASGYIGTLPLDFMKQRFQTSKNVNESRMLIVKSVKENGIRTLFKGGLIGSASIIPQMAIKFTVNDYLSRKTEKAKFLSARDKMTDFSVLGEKLTPFRNGFIAGYVDGSFLGPVLAVQSVLQMELKGSPQGPTYNDAFKVLRRVPIIPFTFPLAMRNATYTSVIFGGQRVYLDTTGKTEQTFMSNFISSSIFNIPGVVACSPFDVIRAKQIQYILENKTNNPFSIARDIYKTNGFRGFYQGFGSLYINFAIRFPVTFSLYFLLMKK